MNRTSRHAARWLLSLCAVVGSVGIATAQPIIAPTFAGTYTLTNLGAVPGVPSNYGGLTLQQGSPNTLLIGGEAVSPDADIYSIAVTRNAQGRISGFSGTAAAVATAPRIDGGLAYGPNGVLFATTLDVTSPMLLQYEVGSTTPDKSINLATLGVTGTTGTVNFVPTGFADAGEIRILTYSTNLVYTGTLTADGTGTFNLTGVTQTDTLPAGTGPEGIVWVPQGSPGFDPAKQFVLISEYDANRVSAYEWNPNGTINVGTRQDFVTGLTSAAGATIDPFTNDFLFSTLGGGGQVFRVSGFAPVPEPAGVLAAAAGVVGLAGLVRRRLRRQPSGSARI
jgi:hypothetical protein